MIIAGKNGSLVLFWNEELMSSLPLGRFTYDGYIKEAEKFIVSSMKEDKKDLITKMRIVFEDLLEEEYIPPKKIKREEYSDSEGSAEEEEYDTIKDLDGFYSLA